MFLDSQFDNILTFTFGLYLTKLVNNPLIGSFYNNLISLIQYLE